MKYFAALILILMGTAYKIAHINDEALTKAQAVTAEISDEKKYEAIDLRKITVRNPNLPLENDTEISEVDFSSTDPSYYDQQFAEGNHEMLESKYSVEASERYKPDMNPEAVQELIQEIKKEI